LRIGKEEFSAGKEKRGYVMVTANLLLRTSFFVALAVTAATGAHAACLPKVEGPIAETDSSKIYRKSILPAGVSEKEYFISCTVAQGTYKTLVQVRAPQDSARQSGIVIAEPWHPGNTWSLYPKIRDYLAREGDTAVIFVGNPMIIRDLIKPAEPARYESLNLPGKGARSIVDTPRGETTEMEIIRQVGALIKSGGLPGVRARKVILGGMSQTGGVVRTYIAYEHNQPGVKSVYDGYFPEQSAVPSYTGPIPDLDVPVVELQGEREFLVTLERGFDHIKYRRADGPLYRLYEVPGLPHIATRGALEPSNAACTGHMVTNFPTSAVYNAALDAEIKWVDRGIAAPHIAPMKTSADGLQLERDAFGNAIGGWRTSYFDVPTATYHATWGTYKVTPSGGYTDEIAEKCDMIGWIDPAAAEKRKSLYPDHAAYVAKVNQDIDALIRSRMLLPEDAGELRSEAQAAAIP
jgi:hypothetical protein